MEDIIDTFLAFLSNVLQSFETIDLSKPSKIFVKILSKEHMEVIRARQRQQDMLQDKDENVLNFGILTEKRPLVFTKHDFIIDMPKGFESDKSYTKHCFDRRCLVLSVIFGCCVQLGVNLGVPDFKPKGTAMWGLKSSNEGNKITACQALLKEFKEVKEKYPILDQDSSQTLSIICPILHKHYGVNIIVRKHCPRDTIVKMFPEHYDEKIPKCDILQVRDGDVAHVGAISYMTYPYKQVFGYMCPLCKLNRTGNSNRHQCKRIYEPACKDCKRILRPNALLYPGSKELFCRGYDDNNPTNCNYCGRKCANGKNVLISTKAKKG